MQRTNKQTKTWSRSHAQRVGNGCLVLGMMLAATAPGSCAPLDPLVEVDKYTNNAIQMAAKVGGKIPVVGPFLSPATSLIFGTPAEPSYAEMRAEWEGYTDKKVEISRTKMLGRKLEGYRKSISAIQSLIEDEEKRAKYERTAHLIDPSRKTQINPYPAKIMAEWQSLQRAILRDRPLFISGDDPAAPLLPMLGAVANLEIDALDRQYILADQMFQSQPDFSKSDFRALLQDKRELTMTECNQELKAEITKAYNERIALIVVRSENSGPSYRRVSFWWVEDGGIPVTKKFLANNEAAAGQYRSAEKTVSDTMLAGFTRQEASERVEAYAKKMKAEEYSKIVILGENLYLIQDTVTLRVDRIHPDLTPEQFREIFGRLVPVIRSSLLLGSKTKPDSYMLIGWDKNLNYAAARSYSEKTGTGYVMMSAANARYARGYWNSESGQQRQRGEIGLRRELLTKVTDPVGALKIEEVRGFDP